MKNSILVTALLISLALPQFAWAHGASGIFSGAASEGPLKTFVIDGNGTYSATPTDAEGYTSGQTSCLPAVLQNPIPGFTALSVCFGIPTIFTNTSTGASEYFWDLGDGATSSLTDPVHTYGSPGTF